MPIGSLDRAFFDAGGVEPASIFRVECARCAREERIGAMLPSHLDADSSGQAKRLRSTCQEQAPLPCRFRHNVRVELLDRMAAMKLAMAWEDEMGPPPAPFNLAEAPALAVVAFEALGSA